MYLEHAQLREKSTVPEVIRDHASVLAARDQGNDLRYVRYCFDWRGSIVSEGDAYWTPVRNVSVDWAEFADARRSKYGPFMNKVRTGDVPWTKLDDLHRMSLDEVVGRQNLDQAAFRS